MAKNKQEFKVGDLVRVSGHARWLPRRNENWARHHIKSGTVCRVAGSEFVVAPDGVGQIVHPDKWRLANQAMRKRDKYAARR